MIEFKLQQELPFSKDIFYILNKLEYHNSVIFGGSIRDFVLSNYQTNTINDYDIRIVSTKLDIDIANSLTPYFGQYTIVPSLGSNKQRFLFNFNGIELDISIRSINPNNSTLFRNALERSHNSDAAISSFVLDSTLACFCRIDAIYDIENNSLTFYNSQNIERLDYYIKKMENKFPNRKRIIVN